MATTRREFEADYAAARGTTRGRLAEVGLHSAPCRCGRKGCPGWQVLDRNRSIPRDVRTEEIKRFGEEGES